MILYYFIAFFTLILISMGFGLYRKLRGSENVFVHALSFVPATCSFLTLFCALSFALSLELLPYIGGVLPDNLSDDSYMTFAYSCLVAAPLLTLLLGIFLLIYFARRNLKKHIYTAYIIVFLASVGFWVFMYNCTWRRINVDNYFFYEVQGMSPISSNGWDFFAPECNLRIAFNSGKIVNLHMSDINNSNCTLYKFKNGDILIKEHSHANFAYIVSPEKEEVYFYSKGYKFKLNGDAILALSDYGEPSQSKTFCTYKYCGFGYGELVLEAIPAENVENLAILGTLNIKSFKGI